MKTMIRRVLVPMCALGLLVLWMPGCNTVKGLGDDIHSVGEAGQEVINDAREE